MCGGVRQKDSCSATCLRSGNPSEHRFPAPFPTARLLLAAASIVSLGVAPDHARAQPADLPAPASTNPTQAQHDIVVVAERSQQDSIDRTTYLVRDNAEARASSALDLLGRVPSVEVSPSGQVRLIGRSGVAIQVDGQEVPNAAAFLRAMQGSQVAKIELVTNPSAQFSARGTGGIINIVTRRSFGAGPGGSVMASAGSFGSHELRSSPSWTQGRLSLNGSIGIRREGSRSRSEEARAGGGVPGAEARLEREDSRGDSDQVNASFGAAVEIAPRQTISLDGLASETDGQRTTRSAIVEEGTRSEERSSATTDGRMRRISASYRREGSRPGGLTSLSASHTSLRLGADRRFVTHGGAGASIFRLRTELTGSSTTFKADHVRPAGDRRLTAGAQFDRNAEDNGQQALTISPPAGPVATDDDFEGSWSEAAAYASYQFPFRGNKVLAGMRVESRWHDIAGTSRDPAPETHFFPSLHAERKLSDRLTANLSYSSRIGWPGLAQLDPRLRFSDPTTARAGNPLLRPERTHSLEFKLMAKPGRHEADLTTYVQRTSDLRSELVELDGGVLISRPVNLGTRTSVGSNLVMRGPLAGRLRYTVSASLAHQRTGDGGLPGVDERATGYGGSLQLDYRDGAEGRAGADQARLALRYTGPSETGLSRISSMISADASWSHALTDRLATVLTASHLLKSPRISTAGPHVVSRSLFRAEGPNIALALTYALRPSAP